MGAPRQGGGDTTEGNLTMKTTSIERRHAWRTLSKQDKQERLQAMRRRHQSQVEFEILRLQTLR